MMRRSGERGDAGVGLTPPSRHLRAEIDDPSPESLGHLPHSTAQESGRRGGDVRREQRQLTRLQACKLKFVHPLYEPHELKSLDGVHETTEIYFASRPVVVDLAQYMVASPASLSFLSPPAIALPS